MAKTTFQLDIDGIHCASCVETVRRTLLAESDVNEVAINSQTGRAIIAGQIDPAKAAELSTTVGYPAKVALGTMESAASLRAQVEERAATRTKQWKRRAIIGLGLWIPMAIIHWGAPPAGLSGPWMDWTLGGMATLVVVLVGPGFLRSALSALRRGGTNMDTLITIGAGTAWAWSLLLFILNKSGITHGQPLYFTEAAVLLGLISLGHWFEARASAKAGHAIRDLLNLQPETAERLDANGSISVIPVAEVKPGDRLLVRPGGSVPVDGVVEEGQSEVDEALMTGEPLPVPRGPGDPMVSGAVNTVGRLVMTATTSGADSTIARIARLVSDTLSSHANIQRVADRVSSIFVPAVLIIALLTIIGWSIYALILQDWDPVATGIVAAVTVLIISCPCALGLATPMAVMVGTGEASRRGILIKSAAALEAAGRADTVLFDKTGTLTEGKPLVSRLTPAAGVSEEELLRFAAAAEASSEHPVALAIVATATERNVQIPSAEDFKAIPGRGVTAKVEGRVVNIDRDKNATCIVKADEQTLGMIDVSDRPLPDAAAAIAALDVLGVHVRMLSGDRSEAALAIAEAVGIHPEAVKAGVSPEDKADVVRHMKSTHVMVGDGINDAAALAASTVGVAVGSGTSIAIDAADVVIPAHRPSAVPLMIQIARRTLRAIHQNLFFAFFYNTCMIPIAAFGLLGPWGPVIAAGAMALSDLTVVGNAVRLGRSLRHMPSISDQTGMPVPDSS